MDAQAKALSLEIAKAAQKIHGWRLSDLLYVLGLTDGLPTRSEDSATMACFSSSLQRRRVRRGPDVAPPIYERNKWARRPPYSTYLKLGNLN
jgi:hypothetical protein